MNIFSLFNADRTLAQGDEKFYLVAIPYQNDDEFDFLYKNIKHVVDDLDSDGGGSILIALATDKEKHIITKSNYVINVIDHNAKKITDYYLLWSRAPNQADKIKGLSIVYPLNSNYTIIKLPPNLDFLDAQRELFPGFSVRQYKKDFKIYQENIENGKGEVKSAINNSANKDAKIGSWSYVLIPVFIFFATILILIFRKKGKFVFAKSQSTKDKLVEKQ